MAEKRTVLLFFQNGSDKLFSYGGYGRDRFDSRVEKDRKKVLSGIFWLVIKCLNKQPEFKTAYKDGILGFYDTLTPLYASFHEDDKTFL